MFSLSDCEYGGIEGTDDAATAGVNRIFGRRLLAGLIGLGASPLAVLAAQGAAADTSICAVRQAPPEASRRDRPDTARGPRNATAPQEQPPAAIVVFAAASAREVAFAKQPEIRVRLCGGLDSVRVVERRNLPSPVVTARTYRDVYVAVEIFGRLDAECIVAALTSAPRDSSGQRNACASLDVGTSRSRPPLN